MFNRRKREQIPPVEPVRTPGQPNVWIMSEEAPDFSQGTFRYFFIEQLTPDGIEFLERSLKQQLVSVDSFQLQTSANGIVLSWRFKRGNVGERLEVREEVRLIALGVLADHFDWRDPLAGKFTSGEERQALAKKLGVSWTLSSS